MEPYVREDGIMKWRDPNEKEREWTWKSILVVLLSIAFVVTCLVIGQKWEQSRLDNQCSTQHKESVQCPSE